MTLRHVVVATTLLAAWYLLAPPVQQEGMRNGRPFYWINDQAPLSAWRHAGSYDSAKSCDTAKWKQFFDTAKTTDAKDSYQAAYMVSDQVANCIASDDPRLRP